MSDARVFRSLYGTYLSHQNGYLVAVPMLDQSCRFHYEWYYDRVALRTHHNQYVGVNHLHAVYTTSQQDAQKFILERIPDGRVAFKSSHNTYIRVEPNGSTRASHNIESGELFVEEMAPPSVYAVSAPPVVVQQPVTVVQPQVRMAAPSVVYAQPPPVVYTQPTTVYAAPPVVVQQPTVVVQRGGPSVLGTGLAVAAGMALGYELTHGGRHHHHHHGRHHHHH